jgi:hypothetical protein
VSAGGYILFGMGFDACFAFQVKAVPSCPSTQAAAQAVKPSQALMTVWTLLLAGLRSTLCILDMYKQVPTGLQLLSAAASALCQGLQNHALQ